MVGKAAPLQSTVASWQVVTIELAPRRLMITKGRPKFFGVRAGSTTAALASVVSSESCWSGSAATIERAAVGLKVATIGTGTESARTLSSSVDTLSSRSDNSRDNLSGLSVEKL